MNSTKQYRSWLTELQQYISQAKMRTSLQVNANMLMVYWYIGKQIQQKIEVEKWGSKIISQLSKDLRKTFPDTKGFSERNLVYMRQFASVYAEHPITPTLSAQFTQAVPAQLVNTGKKAITQAVPAQLRTDTKNEIGQALLTQFGQLSWTHHLILLDKTADLDERTWYIEKTVENMWSSRVLQHMIESGLFHRQHKSKKTTNFHLTLPKIQSDLALQILKDPYKFEFLQVNEGITERDLETQLTTHIQKFLLELGAGFAYVGRQFKLKLGRKEYFLDLLFYHLQLRCFIVIDLKMGEFEPEFAGKMNAYLNVLNREHKQQHDNASIGIILCNSKDEIEVEYALQGLSHPIGVSEYKTMHNLPKGLRDKLPSARQLKEVMREFLLQQKNNSNKPKKK